MLTGIHHFIFAPNHPKILAVPTFKKLREKSLQSVVLRLEGPGSPMHLLYILFAWEKVDHFNKRTGN